MMLSGKQAHVLSNLDRVEELPFKLRVSSPRPRYQLDGWDCTSQITSLVVKKAIARDGAGEAVRFERLRRNVVAAPA